MQESSIVKCRDLMIGDWIQDKHGFRFYIVGVGEDYAYADFEGNEGDLWEFDNEIEPCYGIPLDEVREQVEAVTEITAEFDYLHEFQQYLRVTGQREEANKIKLKTNGIVWYKWYNRLGIQYKVSEVKFYFSDTARDAGSSPATMP